MKYKRYYIAMQNEKQNTGIVKCVMALMVIISLFILAIQVFSNHTNAGNSENESFEGDDFSVSFAIEEKKEY